MPERQPGRLDGRRVLITGGASGLGRAIALAFGCEGADIAITYSESARGAEEVTRELRRQGRRAIALSVDLRQRDQLDRAAQQAVEALDGIDILVNNAGRFSTAGLQATDDSLWDDLLAVNLTAPFRLARALAPRMIERDGGVILNVISGGGLHPRPAYRPSPAYSASKAGLVMLTRVLALDLAPKVRVNGLAPGVVESALKPLSAEAHARVTGQTPLARLGRQSEIASAALFLVSDDSAFVTGQVLSVDGGILT